MANKKFSQFDLKTNSTDVQFVVGYNGTDNVRIAPANIGGNPAGSDAQLQYNNGGAFGAITGATFDDTNGRLYLDTTRVVIGGTSSFQNGLTVNDPTEFRNTVEFPDGSASAPGITFFNQGDDNTGIFRPGNDIIAFATGGSEEFRIGANGEIGLSGANFGTSGQVLTSNGTGSGASWTTIGGGGASSLNGLSDVTVDLTNDNAFFISIPSGLSGATGNLFLGENAGSSVVGSSKNVAIGFDAFKTASDSSRDNNVCIGYESASLSAFQNQYNVFVGNESGKNLSNCYSNVAIGYKAMSTGSGFDSVAVGYQAGKTATGSAMAAFGWEAGRDATGLHLVAIGGSYLVGGAARDVSGDFNVAVGAGAMQEVDSDGNVAVGYAAARNQTTAVNSVSIGYFASNSNTTSGYRTMVGYEAGKNHTGMFSTGIGMDALESGSGVLNVAVGSNSMKANNGSRSVAVGHQAMQGATSAGDCVAIGADALNSSSAGNYNVAVGSTSARVATSAENVSIGYHAHYNMTSGGRNIAIGYQAGYGETEQEDNIFIGHKAGFGQVGSNNSDHNVVIGNNAKINNSTNFSQNVVIGSEACELGTGIINYNVTIGYRANENSGSGHNYDSVAIGQGAGQNTAAEGNVIIGYNAQEPSLTGGFNTIIGKQAKVGNTGSTGTNNLVLGYQAQSSASNVTNEITLGNSSITSLRCAVTSITSLSDERDKSEIKDLEYGLAFIDALQPREFVWDNRPETKLVKDIESGTETEEEFYSSNKGKKDFGFIAQEVQELDNDTLRLVYSENEDKLELSYGKLVPILVKAIQELKEEVELLKAK